MSVSSFIRLVCVATGHRQRPAGYEPSGHVHPYGGDGLLYQEEAALYSCWCGESRRTEGRKTYRAVRVGGAE